MEYIWGCVVAYKYFVIFGMVILVCFCVMLFHAKISKKYFKMALKKKKILIVDDKNFPYFSQLKRNSYQVEKVKDVDERRMQDIEEGMYAVILLDIKGVGKLVGCCDEGFGLLKYIKEKRPEQCVLVFSDEQWNLECQENFARADKVLPKTAGYLQFKNEIDSLIIKSDFCILAMVLKLIRTGIALWKKISW